MVAFVKKKNLFIALIVCFIMTAFFLLEQKWFTVNPFEKLPLDGLVYAACDEKGNILIADEAGGRLLKISSDGKLQWMQTTKEGLFSGIKRIVVKGDSIYLHDVEISEGILIGKERLLEFNADGKFVRTVMERSYGERVLKPYIVGFWVREESLSYVYTQEDMFRVVDAESGEEKVYPLPQARLLLLNVVYDLEKDLYYYVTYNGKIYEYIDGVNDRLLYDAKDSDRLSIPREVSYDQKGSLYVSDIGTRDLFVIRTETGEISGIEEEGDLFEKEIAYNVSAENGVLSRTDYSVKRLTDSGEYEYITDCGLTFLQKFICILVRLTAVLVIISVLFILLWGIHWILKMGSKYTKILAAVSSGILAVGIFISAVLLPQVNTIIKDAFYVRAELAAAATLSNFPTDAFVRLDSPDDFLDEDYLKVKKGVTDVFFQDSDSVRDLYCILYRYIDGMVVQTYCLDDNAGAIYPYDWEFEGSPEQRILVNKQGERFESDTGEGSYLLIYEPILDENGEAVGIMEVGKDMSSFKETTNNLIINLLVNEIAVAVVAMMLIFELIYFLKGRNRYLDLLEENSTDASKIELPAEILRMIAFMVFFLTNLTTSFLPLYAMHLAEKENIGIPSAVMAAIPISADVVTGALFSILGAKVVRLLGEKRSVILSAIVFISGFALRIIPNIWVLVLGCAMIGVGWGIILLVVNTHIAMMPDERKADGFSQYSAAAQNGVNCGVVCGGFLVNWVDFHTVFIIATVLSVGMLIISKKYLTTRKIQDTGSVRKNKTSTVRFLFSPRIMIFFVMIVVPVIICGYFLNYMYPIIGSEYGLSESYLGYSYLLNGICIMLLSTVMTRFFSTKKKLGLFTASVVYGIAFLEVAVFQNIPSLFVALVLLGIADSFGLPLQNSYYTDLEEVEKYGYDEAMGIYSLFENGSQALGSFVFSYVLLIGVGKGLMTVLTVLVGLALLFLLTGLVGSKKKRHTH